MKSARWFLGLVTQNFGWKLLSLAIALVIWALVASEPELTTLATVRLEYRNVPDDLEISSASTDTVRLELQGSSGQLRSLDDTGSQRPAATIDMSGTQPGEHTFMIGGDNLRLPRGVRLIRAIPSEVRFVFDHRVTRPAPVSVRFVGEGVHGYVIGTSIVDPAQVRIVGPERRVASITAAVTDPIDVSSVVGTREFRVNTFVDDPYVRFENSSQVTVTVTMKKK